MLLPIVEPSVLETKYELSGVETRRAKSSQLESGLVNVKPYQKTISPHPFSMPSTGEA